MSPPTRSSANTATNAGENRTNLYAPAHAAPEADWLLQSLACTRDLLSQIDYGAVINAAITKVQTLLGADSASVCLLETGPWKQTSRKQVCGKQAPSSYSICWSKGKIKPALCGVQKAQTACPTSF